ncbi:hypothetical protein [Pseudomonas purpurea]|uniref:hypothetical protein n=1 Tax=Pseudomonas purpurea TaxID=3136737 RepID=UPI003267E886
MSRTNCQAGTITLASSSRGNVSIKVPGLGAAAQLYSVPGHCVLFALQPHAYAITRYRIEGECLTRHEHVVVDARHPVHINGAHELFEQTSDGQENAGVIASFNFPDKTADIQVFDRSTLQKTGWFPADDSAARFLTCLELLEGVADPHTFQVAEELIYHYHPGVAWKAFQQIHHASPNRAQQYVRMLGKHHNPRLNTLLERI